MKHLKNRGQSFGLAFLIVIFGMTSAWAQKSIGINSEKAFQELGSHPRSRTFEINPQLQNFSQSNLGDTLLLDFFGDKHYKAVVKQVGKSYDGIVGITAQVTNTASGYCYISIAGNDFALSAELPQKDELFAVKKKNGQYYLTEQALSEVQHEHGGECGHVPENDGSTLRAASVTTPTLPESNTAVTVDMLVVYTPAAKAVAVANGSTIDLDINAGIQQSNLVLRNSQTNVTLNLVYKQEINYTETTNPPSDLNRLRDPGDGYADEAHALRTRYNADLVVLLLGDNSSNIAGVAYIMNTESGNPQSGFAVVKARWVANGYTLIHEIGHNLGCGHHVSTDTDALYDYSHGYGEPSSSGNFSTIMTYGNLGLGAQIPYFSDQGVMYNSVAVGTADANNAKTIRQTKGLIAAYSDEVPWTDAFLQNITLSSGALSPTFNPGVYQYTVNVPNSVASINVTGVANSSHATVSGNVTAKPLVTGSNTVLLKVADGWTNYMKTYTVNIIRSIDDDGDGDGDGDGDATTCTITYNSNGGSGTMSSQTKTKGVKLRLSRNAFAPPPEHQFDGWATSPTGAVKYADRDSFGLDANTTLYAKWYIPEVSITLNKSIINGSKSLKIGNKEQLIATVLPNNATNKEVIWSSSNDFVVAVNQSGVLTAMKAGKAIITATTKQGGKQASCEVTVVEKSWAVGSSLSADYDGEETLYIRGSGPMQNYNTGANDVPWSSYKNKITTVIIYTGVTTIGKNSFNGLSNLISVTIPTSVTEIGSEAFKNCHSLYSLTILKEVTEIGTSAFQGCDGLQAVYNYRTTPQKLEYAFGAFEAEIYSRVTLYVPAGAKQAYTDNTPNAEEWKRFKNIEEGLLSVTFETNESEGGSFVPSRDVVYGAHLAPPADPTFYGRKFAGWYYTNNGQNITWNFDSDIVTTNLTLRAKWLRAFQVDFVTNGGTAVYDQAVWEGDKVAALRPQAPVRTGYIFDGWCQDRELLIPWDIATKVVDITTAPVNRYLTLYAKWRLSTSPPPSTAIDLINAADTNPEHTPSVQVYPNPTTGELNIQNTKGAEINLYNTAGILLQSTHETKINLSGYPNGIYFLRTGATTVKVVKR
ncbi:bacterial Ig-like domain [Candidatus Symbiothrix dinenymphae]|nr:bacterial Ig-like domain [Candidatus Symbiothrix dinenymphae]